MVDLVSIRQGRDLVSLMSTKFSDSISHRTIRPYLLTSSMSHRVGPSTRRERNTNSSLYDGRLTTDHNYLFCIGEFLCGVVKERWSWTVLRSHSIQCLISDKIPDRRLTQSL